ncbi:MAG: PAS domain S-box protein [Azospirillaceae bacterium]|nr:PAS domain S-box protein [Azospirillaceae bacterium]
MSLRGSTVKLHAADLESWAAPAFVVDVAMARHFSLAAANARFHTLAGSGDAAPPGWSEASARCVAGGHAVEALLRLGEQAWRTVLVPLLDEAGRVVQIQGTCIAPDCREPPCGEPPCGEAPPVPGAGDAPIADPWAFADDIAAALVVVDIGGRVVKVNAPWTALFGHTAGEARSLRAEDLVPTPHQLRFKRIFDRFVAGRRDRGRFHAMVVIPTGSRIVRITAKRQGTVAEPIAVVAIIEDVTAAWHAHHRARAELRDQRDMIIRLGPDTTVSDINGPAARNLGCEPAAVIGRPLAEFLQPAMREMLVADIASMTPATPECRFELPIVGADGEFRWFLWTNHGYFEANGRLFECHLVGIEITAQKRLETDLRASNDRFRLAVAGTRDGIWDWDVTTGAVWFSSRWKEMLGYSDSDLANDRATWTVVLHPDDRQRAMRLFEEHWYDDTPLDTTLRFCHRDGTVRSILCRGTTVRDAAGRPLRTIGAHTDVTALTEAREALRIARAEADQANRAKTEFLAMMSHELRTPLNAVIGFAEILRDQLFGPLGSERYDEYVELILQSGRHLFSIINDILDIANVDAGQVTLRETVVRFGPLAQGLVVQFRAQALASGISIDLAFDEPGPMVRGDDVRIRQILSNLLSNAIKFSHRGDRVRVSTGQRNDGMVFLAVADTGIGMAEEDVPRALMPFSQLDSSLARRHEGTGLGLATVKRLVDLHGATLDIRTRLGEGTVVSVLFPPNRNVAVATRPGVAPPRPFPVGEPVAKLDYSGTAGGSAALAETLLEAIPLGAAVVTEDGICLRFNHVLTRMVGLPEGRFIDRPFVDMFPNEQGDIRLVTETRPRECQLMTADQRVLRVELTSMPFKGADDRRYRLVLVVDVTEQRNITLALKASEERFRLAVRAARWGSWDMNMLTGQFWLSAGFVAMLGCDADKIVDYHRFWRDRVYPGELPAVEAGIADHLNGKTPAVEATFRIRHQDGHYLSIAIRGVSSFDEAGRPVRFTGIVADVTPLRTAEAALQDALDLLGIVRESLTQGLVVVGADRRVRLANPLIGSMYDLPAWALEPGTRIEDVCRYRAARGDFGVFADDEAREQEVEVRCRHLLAERPAPLVDRPPNGQIIEVTSRRLSDNRGFALICNNVTERRSVEAALRLNEQRLRQCHDIAKLGYWQRQRDVPDADPIWSDSLYDLCGVDPATFKPTGPACDALVHPDDLSLFHAPVEGREGRFVREFRIRRPDGECRYVRDEFRIDSDPHDGTRRAFGVIQDITERKLQEIALAEGSAHLRAILDVAITGIISIDQEGRIDVFNRMAERMFGWTSEAIQGQSILRLFPDPDGIEGRSLLATVTVGAGVDGAGSERMARRCDGSLVPVQIAVERFVTGGRNLYVCVVVDVSQQKTRERELRETRDRLLLQTRALEDARLRAESANQAKSEFLAQMSHELRTPLNAIIGFSEIMQGEYFGPMGSPKYREYADDLHASGIHLLSLINDILDLSKVEAGRYVLEESKVEIDRLVEESARLLRQRAANKGVALVMKLDPTPVVMADPRALKQILVNLLTNAIKFTIRGGTVEVRAAQEAGGGIRLTVEDSGIGIPAAELNMIIEPFRQASNARRSGERGTGLGLAIVRSLVELHHGEFEIRSEVGVGTAAVVRLPAARVVRSQSNFQPWDVVADDA